MRRASFVFAFVVGVLCSASLVRAEEAKGFTRSLLGDDVLSGWVVTGCEVEYKSGELLLKAGEGFVRSAHEYDDFILELDWKPLQADKWDSGIYIRSPAVAEGKQWPSQWQINLLKGAEGNLLGFKEAVSTGLVKPGDWNHFLIKVIGTTASLEINGKPAWKVDGLTRPRGYVGIQSEVTMGGQYLFRNIKLTELGYTSLFNGKDLTGWEGGGQPAEKCWLVKDGLLICNGKAGPWLKSTAEFGDFNLRLEYRIKAGGNSGVFCRVPADGNHHGPSSGVEVQILDDAHPKYATLKDYQYSAGVYDIVGASPKVSLPVGQWNTLEINCQGPAYRITHNGIVVVDANVEKYPLLKERLVKGFLGLQNHSEEVAFRNIRIGAAH